VTVTDREGYEIRRGQVGSEGGRTAGVRVVSDIPLQPGREGTTYDFTAEPAGMEDAQAVEGEE
jgi:hypothetical protein